MCIERPPYKAVTAPMTNQKQEFPSAKRSLNGKAQASCTFCAKRLVLKQQQHSIHDRVSYIGLLAFFLLCVKAQLSVVSTGVLAGNDDVMTPNTLRCLFPNISGSYPTLDLLPATV